MPELRLTPGCADIPRAERATNTTSWSAPMMNIGYVLIAISLALLGGQLREFLIG
jgi:hypothetical protein